ncbi:hydrolase [Aliamphritea ceti]|uniref:hydrolase n=1 Tax=Aliamphritea ceti TaxID=1524258 RepID=UPI0021C2E991|nr:hydrolase [Aliamphritea ceti]
MLTAETTALIVIDVQGKLARSMYNAETMLQCITRAIQGAKILGIPVLHIEQYPQGLGATLPEVSELLADQTPMSKTTFDCCGNPEIVSRIESLNKTNLLVCGLEAHICVYQSVRSLLSKGYNVEIIEDAISSRTAENRALGLNRMTAAGAQRTSVEMCLFDLVQDAASPAFRQLLPLFK